MLGGCGVLVLGVTLTVIGIVTGTTPLFLAGTTVAGAGYGAAFLGAFRTLAALASPTGRGALVAAIYIVCYLSVALPVVVAGILVTQLGLRPTSIGYGIVLAVLAALAIPATLRATVRDDRIRC
jgi:MFS family permease